MPENVDNSPFLGQFTLEQFVSKICVLKIRAIPTQNRRSYIKFFYYIFCEMTEKKTARIFIKRKCPKFGQFTKF